MYQSRLNETLQKVKETSNSLKDLYDIDKEDIDIYMNEESENEESVDHGDLITISDHLKTPNDELLFLVNNDWNNYATTFQKCGKRVLKNYMSDNKLVSMYGKSASELHEKVLHEREETIRKKRINDVKLYLNRKKKRSGVNKRDNKIKIVGHKLTVAGTLYDMIFPEGTSKKILHSTLMNTSPVEVANYHERIDKSNMRNSQLKSQTVNDAETINDIPTQTQVDQEEPLERNEGEESERDEEPEILVTSILKHKIVSGQ